MTESPERDGPRVCGGSAALRIGPPVLLTFAVVALVLIGPGAAFAFALPALVLARLLPWGFDIDAEGIGLWYGFGGYRFVAREEVTVRADRGGVVVFRRPRRRLGTPLTTGLLDLHRLDLARVFAAQGYTLTRELEGG